MRSTSSSLLATLMRLCIVALLFVQVVPAQLDCRCDGPGPMDCCRTPEATTLASASACCFGSGEGPSLHASACARAESNGVVVDANLAPPVEHGKPQLEQMAFLADEAGTNLRLADRNFDGVAHGPPGSARRAIYLFCASLLI